MRCATGAAAPPCVMLRGRSASQPARSTFVPAAAPGSVAWNGRDHNALANLAVYLGGVLDELVHVRSYLNGTFDHGSYKTDTQALLRKVNEVLDAMQADGGDEDYTDADGDD